MIQIAFVTISLLAFPFSTVSAEEPDLIGQWAGEYEVHIHHPDHDEPAIGMASMMLNVQEQDGAFILATQTWELHEDHEGKPDIKGEVVRSGTESLSGILFFDHQQIRLLELEDNGIFEGHIVDESTLHLIYHEQDHDEATLFRVILKRKSD